MTILLSSLFVVIVVASVVTVRAIAGAREGFQDEFGFHLTGSPATSALDGGSNGGANMSGGDLAGGMAA